MKYKGVISSFDQRDKIINLFDDINEGKYVQKLPVKTDGILNGYILNRSAVFPLKVIFYRGLKDNQEVVLDPLEKITVSGVSVSELHIEVVKPNLQSAAEFQCLVFEPANEQEIYEYLYRAKMEISKIDLHDYLTKNQNKLVINSIVPAGAATITIPLLQFILDTELIIQNVLVYPLEGEPVPDSWSVEMQRVRADGTEVYPLEFKSDWNDSTSGFEFLGLNAKTPVYTAATVPSTGDLFAIVIKRTGDITEPLEVRISMDYTFTYAQL